MLAAFPRTSVYPTVRPRVQKHLNKLGKVSHQMKVIIEDIQGPKEYGLTGSRALRTKTLDCEGRRKRVNVREREETLYEDRTSPRRKYRRLREAGGKSTDMASQTTLLGEVLSEESNKTDETGETPSVFGKEYCEKQDSQLLHRKRCKTDRSIIWLNADDTSPQTGSSAWQRPLPPIPAPDIQQTTPQATLYQKLFETLKDKIGADVEDVSSNRRCRDNHWTSPSFSPTKSLSLQIEERESSRYADIDFTGENAGAINGDDNIYESIDESSDCEPDSNSKFPLPKGFPRSPRPKFRKSEYFSPGITTPCSFRNFDSEESYLVPVCRFDRPLSSHSCQTKHADSRSDNTRPRPLCSGYPEHAEFQDGGEKTSVSENRDGVSVHYKSDLCNDSADELHLDCPLKIKDYQYSPEFETSPAWSRDFARSPTLPRDSARSPTWSHDSVASSRSSSSLRATYV